MLQLHLYGLLIGLGCWVGLVVAEKAQRRLSAFDSQYQKIVLESLLLWIFIPAVIGARAYHVISEFSYYMAHPELILAIWAGGLGIYGALAGGVIGILLWWKLHHVPQPAAMWRIFDILAFGLPVAQAIGRFGNYINQELYGLPTSLPWGMYISPEHRPVQFSTNSYFHPLFLYEALGNCLILITMWKGLQQPRMHGTYIMGYILGYSSLRFLLDFLRIDPWRLGVFSTAQWISLGLMLISFLWLIRHHYQVKKDYH